MSLLVHVLLAIGAITAVTSTAVARSDWTGMSSLRALERDVERCLTIADREPGSRADKLARVALFVGQHRTSVRSRLNSDLVDRTAYFMLDNDRKTRKYAAEAIMALKPASMPAAKRVFGVLKSEPEPRMDPAFVWWVQLKIVGDHLPLAAMIRERIARLPAASSIYKSKLMFEISILVRLHDVAGAAVSDELIDEIARLVDSKYSDSDIPGRAASVLSYLGPRAKRAVPVIERAAEREQRETAQAEFCINMMCRQLLYTFEHALKCLKMEDMFWAQGGSAACRPQRIEY